MQPRFGIALLTAWALAAPDVLPAQFGTPQLSGAGTSITFTLPVNLTQLSPDLERVQFMCGIMGDGLISSGSFSTGSLQALLVPKDEVYVFGGQLVTTMKVMVSIPIEVLDAPIGKTAQYQCALQGFSKRLQSWNFFSETSTEPAFLLKPAPPVIKGTFTW